jgi:hypothetical protein
MRVRDALTFAARLFRSGYRSDEAAALFALAREHYRLLAKIARIRDDRNAWRRQSADHPRCTCASCRQSAGPALDTTTHHD